MTRQGPPRSCHALAACCGGMLWNTSTRAFCFALVPRLVVDAGLIQPQGTLLVSATHLGYVVGAMMAHRLPLPARAAIWAGQVVTVAGGLLLTEARTYPAFFLAVLCLTVGAGIYFPRGMGIIGAVSVPGSLGRNLGWHEIAAALGFVAGPLCVSLAGNLHWRTLVLIWVVPTTLGSALAFAHPSLQVQELPREHGPQARGRLARLAGFGVTGAFLYALVTGLTSVLPLALVSAGWAGPGTAAGLLAMGAGAAAVAPFATGRAADRYGGVKVLIWLWVLTAGGLVAMGLARQLPGFAAALVVMMLGAGGAMPIYWMLAAPPQYLRDLGLLTAVTTGMGSVGGSAVLGLLAVRTPGLAIWAAAGCAVFGLASMPVIQRLTAAQPPLPGVRPPHHH